MDYEQIYVLFQNLKLKNNPHHHWNDNNGWAMAESIKRVVLKKTKEVMQGANLFSLSCDDVTFVDCQSLITVHSYVVINWKPNLVLLTRDIVIERGPTNNLIVVIVNAANGFVGKDMPRSFIPTLCRSNLNFLWRGFNHILVTNI